MWFLRGDEGVTDAQEAKYAQAQGLSVACRQPSQHNAVESSSSRGQWPRWDDRNLTVDKCTVWSSGETAAPDAAFPGLAAAAPAATVHCLFALFFASRSPQLICP